MATSTGTVDTTRGQQAIHYPYMYTYCLCTCTHFQEPSVDYLLYEQVYQSPEVQQHLPTQSFTFSSVDKEWRELLESAATNPSVMTVCLKDGTYTNAKSSIYILYMLSTYVTSSLQRCTIIL